MKQVYEEPMMVTVVFEDVDVVTVSGADKEPGDYKGSYDVIFGTE